MNLKKVTFEIGDLTSVSCSLVKTGDRFEPPTYDDFALRTHQNTVMSHSVMITIMSFICNSCGKKYSNEYYQKNRFCESCGSFLSRTAPITVRATRRWLFQINPDKFRIHDWWKDHPDLNEMTWTDRQYNKDIRKGHQGILWVAGPSGGIYATFETVTKPRMSIDLASGEYSYWIERSEQRKSVEHQKIRIRYIDKLFNNPLTHGYCKRDPVLSTIEVFTRPQGTNFKLSNNQWDRINQIIQQRKHP